MNGAIGQCEEWVEIGTEVGAVGLEKWPDRIGCVAFHHCKLDITDRKNSLIG